MYNNDVGKGVVVYAYEAYEVKERVALVRVPFYFINLWLISYRHRYCTYLYYSYDVYMYIYIVYITYVLLLHAPSDGQGWVFRDW